MARRKRSSKNSSLITAVLIIGALILFGYYLFTGADPLDLFGGDAPPPPGAPPAVVGSGGDWWRVYFTDPANVNDPNNLTGTVPAQLIDHINNAEDSIDIAAFEFNLTPVAEALIDAHRRGVNVRWITDDEHGLDADMEEGHGQFAMLEGAGIEVRDDGRSALMHNKFWIFDNQTVWTGSTNITQNGSFRNNNNAIVIESADVAAIYEREFEEMWNGEFGPRSPSTLNNQFTVIDNTPIQVYFSPEDEVLDALIALVESAESDIRFMAFSFTHDGLGQAMLNEAEDGVDVQGIVETRSSETEFSELHRLYCAGLPVRQDGNPRTFHHKVIIIDGQTVITGSLNFSDNANERNDENVIVITNADIANQYLQEFQRRWPEATPPDEADMDC